MTTTDRLTGDLTTEQALTGAVTRQAQDPAEPSPREIVARLHERIAAQSADHAALVAAYQDTRAARRVPPGPARAFPRSPQRSRLARLEAYAALRAAQVTRQAAAAQLGVCRRTADRYEETLSGDRA